MPELTQTITYQGKRLSWDEAYHHLGYRGFRLTPDGQTIVDCYYGLADKPMTQNNFDRIMRKPNH